MHCFVYIWGPCMIFDVLNITQIKKVSWRLSEKIHTTFWNSINDMEKYPKLNQKWNWKFFFYNFWLFRLWNLETSVSRCSRFCTFPTKIVVQETVKHKITYVTILLWEPFFFVFSDKTKPSRMIKKRKQLFNNSLNNGCTLYFPMAHWVLCSVASRFY